MKYRPVIKAEQRWLYALISWMLLLGGVIFLVGGSVMLWEALTSTPPHRKSGAIRNSVGLLGLGAAFGVVGVFTRVLLRRWDRWYPSLRKSERVAEFVAWDMWLGRDRWLHRWVDWWARLWDRAEARSAERREKSGRDKGQHHRPD